MSAFEYFDEKNRDRIDAVKHKMDEQRKHLHDVKDVLEIIKNKLDKNEEHFEKEPLKQKWRREENN